MGIIRRIMNLFRGFASLFVTGIEESNPEALLENARNKIRNLTAEFLKNREKQAAFVEGLKRALADGENSSRQLEAKVNANLKVGNQAVAAQYALELESLEGRVSSLRTQYQDAENTYADLRRSHKVAVDEAQNAIRRISGKIGQAKMDSALAEMKTIANDAIGEMSSGTGDLARVEEIANTVAEKAAGKLRVAKDGSDMSGVVMKEAEQNALADSALAAFAAKRGIALPDSPETEKTVEQAPAEKVMG